MLQAGLIDGLRLVIEPALHAAGRKLFETTKPAQFALTRCRTSSTGYLMLDYQLRR